MAPPTEIEIILGRAGPDWMRRAMLRLEERVDHLTERITTIMSMQEHLDADLSQMNADLQAVVAELKSQAGANTILDFSRLDAFAANLHSAATGSNTGTTTGGTPTPAPASTASTPVDTSTSAPGGGPGVAQVPGPYYTFDGSDPSIIDTTQWTLTNLTTTDGKPLYTHTGDTPGGEPTGADSTWVAYTGATQAATTPITTPANEPPATPPAASGTTPPATPGT